MPTYKYKYKCVRVNKTMRNNMRVSVNASGYNRLFVFLLVCLFELQIDNDFYFSESIQQVGLEMLENFKNYLHI